MRTAMNVEEFVQYNDVTALKQSHEQSKPHSSTFMVLSYSQDDVVAETWSFLKVEKYKKKTSKEYWNL